MNPTTSTTHTRTTKIGDPKGRMKAIELLHTIGYAPEIIALANVAGTGIKAEKRDLDFEAFVEAAGIQMMYVRSAKSYVLLNEETDWLPAEIVRGEMEVPFVAWAQIEARQVRLAIEAYKAGEMEQCRFFIGHGISRIGN